MAKPGYHSKLDEVTPEKNWRHVNIGVIGDNEIHLVWVYGKLPGRCHQYCEKGKPGPPQDLCLVTWFRANWDAMGTDASGNLYWIMQLHALRALYYSYWTGENWVDPPGDTQRDPAVARGMGQLAIHGNELNLIVHHPEIFEVWHIWGQPSVLLLPTKLLPGYAGVDYIPRYRRSNPSDEPVGRGI
jgi:hypothetical protein